MNKHCKLGIILASALLLLVISLLVPRIFPLLYESQLNKKLLIAPESEMLKKFTNPPVPLLFKIRLFNVTNIDGILEGEKPILQEVGPYTYIQKRQKVDIKFNHSIGTIQFNLKKFYYFDPELSVGSEADLINTVNPVYLSMISQNSITANFMLFLWGIQFESKPFITKSVGELLFSGYNDSIVEDLYEYTGKEKFKSGKFGFFHPKNGSMGERIEIFTGEMGMETYQHLLRYQGEKELDYWNTDQCNMINGTDGGQFPRPVSTEQIIEFFSADLCRSIYGVYEKDVYLGPLKLHRFVLPEKALAKSKENDCFCSSNFTCRASMIDVSPCKGGSPIVISTPHFYQGSEDDINELVGLHPLKSEHETFLDIEPTTGVTLRANKRIQINMAIRQTPKTPFANVSDVILPILWVSESAEAPLASAELLYSKVTVPFQAVQYGSWACFGISLILGALYIYLCYKAYKRSKAVK